MIEGDRTSARVDVRDVATYRLICAPTSEIVFDLAARRTTDRGVPTKGRLVRSVIAAGFMLLDRGAQKYAELAVTFEDGCRVDEADVGESGAG